MLSTATTTTMVRENPLFPLSLSLIVCSSFIARSASCPTGGQVMTTRFVSGGLVSHTAPLSLWWRVTFHPSVQFTRATVSVGVAHGCHGQSFNGESSGIFPLAARLRFTV